jgi:hypothetical protein
VIAAVVRICTAALAFVPASAGTDAARPPVLLAAAPAHVTLAGNARTVVRVTNSGTKSVVVDVAPAGFALGLRGRPRVVAGGVRSAARWLLLRPRRLALAPRAAGTLVVISKLPRRAEPGDHDALVLLITRPVKSTHLAVRLRLGVTVVVRAPGKIVRALELRRLRRERRGGVRLLELVVANRGNVTEPVVHARAVVTSTRNGRRIATLVTGVREVLPRTVGLLEFPFRKRLRGLMTVRIVIPSVAGRGALRRTYRLRL